MLTDQTIEKLKALIDEHAGADKDRLIAALEDLGRVIASQSLLIRNMRMELENAQVSTQIINGIVEQAMINSLLSNLDPPKRNPFSMEEVKTASEQLVAKVKSANDFTEILKGVVQVAKVFI